MLQLYHHMCMLCTLHAADFLELPHCFFLSRISKNMDGFS